MDTELISKVATAVAAELSGATFSQPIDTVERSYADWELPLEQSTPLRIDVVPVSSPKTDLEGRGAVGFKVPIDIVVRKKFERTELVLEDGRIDMALIDGLVKLVLEIHAFFVQRRLASFENAAWDATEIMAAYVPQHLRSPRQFTGIVRVTYDVSTPL